MSFLIGVLAGAAIVLGVLYLMKKGIV